MRKPVYLDTKQLLNLRTVLGICSVVILVFLSSLDTLIRLFPVTHLQPNDYHTTFLLEALNSDTLVSFIPIVSALPCSANYIDDIKNKFVRFCLFRSSYRSYLIGCVWMCFLSGGVVIIIGILLSWGMSALLLMPMETVVVVPSNATTVFCEKCILLFLNGGFWAVIGLTMSTVMESKYIAYVSPFIVYYLLVILCERYFPDAWLLYPKNWIRSEIWPGGSLSAAFFILELLTLCGLGFYFRGKRRLESL